MGPSWLPERTLLSGARPRRSDLPLHERGKARSWSPLIPMSGTTRAFDPIALYASSALAWTGMPVPDAKQKPSPYPADEWIATAANRSGYAAATADVMRPP